MRSLVKTLTLAIFTLGLTVSLAGASLAAPGPKDKTPAAVKAEHKAPSFLFVVYSEKANIKKLKDGQYTLTMQHTDINHVIEFSDRPYRIVKYITGNNLQKLWSKGKNSFAADPPNAVLSASKLKPVIIVLDSIQVNNKTVTFTIHSTVELDEKTLGQVAVVVDAGHAHIKFLPAPRRIIETDEKDPKMAPRSDRSNKAHPHRYEIEFRTSSRPRVQKLSVS